MTADTLIERIFPPTHDELFKTITALIITVYTQRVVLILLEILLATASVSKR